MGEGKQGENFREREFTLSLDFSTIGLSNPGEAKGKVDPHCKGYAWVPGLWSFDNSERYGSSPIQLFSSKKP